MIRTCFVIALSLLSSPLGGQGIEGSLETLRIELAVRHLVNGQPITLSPELERVVLLTEQARAMLGPAAKAPEIPRRHLDPGEVFYYYVIVPLTQRREPAGDRLAPWHKWSVKTAGEHHE
ncbi:MAG: hypothetical protein HY646_14450 [Acidobacteria bacterium]|nr:hypothetical protein [Acidobacteriota bacterium]